MFVAVHGCLFFFFSFFLFLKKGLRLFFICLKRDGREKWEKMVAKNRENGSKEWEYWQLLCLSLFTRGRVVSGLGGFKDL